MSAPRRKPTTPAAPPPDSVEAKLLDGHYDRLLDEFQQTLEETAAVLRQAYEAMKAENTPRS
jgi:hypothetical protein